jgi:hypothetical protein
LGGPFYFNSFFGLKEKPAGMNRRADRFNHLARAARTAARTARCARDGGSTFIQQLGMPGSCF